MGPSEHPSPQLSSQFAFGQFRVDPGSRQLWCEDRLIPLNTRVFDTLLVLLKHHDRVVEKDELMRTVWPDSFVSEDSLTQSIWALRRALGDHSSQPSFVATVPRRGYRFVAPVTTGSSEPAPAREPHPAEAGASRRGAAPPGSGARIGRRHEVTIDSAAALPRVGHRGGCRDGDRRRNGGLQRRHRRADRHSSSHCGCGAAGHVDCFRGGSVSRQPIPGVRRPGRRVRQHPAVGTHSGDR